jgi:signal transduction histidine kinase
MQEPFPEVYTQFITNIILLAALVSAMVLLVLYFKKSKNVQLKEMERMKVLFEKELAQTQLEIQEEIMKDISMEIHDNIGQVMLLSKINLSMLESMEYTEEATQLVKETKQILTKAIEDISALSRSMHPERIAELGVASVIADQLNMLANKGLFQVQINNLLPDDGQELDRSIQLVIFRMYQEITKNILKHAEATLVKFQIEKKEDHLLVLISDNGKGFDQENNKQDKLNTGIGMKSLQARAALLNGTVTISSELTKGTTVSIFIPV